MADGCVEICIISNQPTILIIPPSPDVRFIPSTITTANRSDSLDNEPCLDLDHPAPALSPQSTYLP